MKIATFVHKLERLDLQLVANKLMSPEYGCGWSLEKTEIAIENYKKFLMLQHLYPSFDLVPSKEIDIVWHEHILVNTYKYIQDCHYLFGYLLHHRWTDSKKDVLEAKKAKTDFARTKVLFMEIFPQGILGETAFEAAPCVDLPISAESSHDMSACLSLPKYSSPHDSSSHDLFYCFHSS